MLTCELTEALLPLSPLWSLCWQYWASWVPRSVVWLGEVTRWPVSEAVTSFWSKLRLGWRMSGRCSSASLLTYFLSCCKMWIYYWKQYVRGILTENG